MRRRDDTGATAMEFAILIPVAITLIFSAIYAATYYYYSAAASYVAHQVARDASIPQAGGYPSAADEQQVASHAAGSGVHALLPAPTSIALDAQPKPAEGNELTVTVTYQLPAISKISALLPFLPHSDGVLTKTVTVRYE